MTTYIDRKSTVVAQSMKRSSSQAGSLLGRPFIMPDLAQSITSKFSRTKSELFKSALQFGDEKEGNKSSVPKLPRIKSSPTEFPKPIEEASKLKKEIKGPVSLSRGGDHPSSIRRKPPNNLSIFGERDVKKEQNDHS